MTFEGLVDRLTSLFDVTQARAVDVVNERLSDMVTRSGALRAVVSLGTTVNGTASYTLAPNVVKILRAEVQFVSGTVEYLGVATLEDFWDVAAGRGEFNGGVIAIEADSDSSATTDNFRLHPTPGVSGRTITGLVALRPATLTYTSGTALPIPIDLHSNLLAGAKAELFDDESRQDEAAKNEGEFEAGIKRLEFAVNKRGKGTQGTRMRMVGYDVRRMA
jgi:hypothetical protein